MLQIDSVCKSFGHVDVLKDVSVEARKGEFLVLLGPSGCGKSTLLSMIAGLEDLSSGAISIDGRDVTDLEPKERDIAMVFQSYALYPGMTVRDNMGFGMKVRGVDRTSREQAIARVSQILKLESLLDRKPAQLSGGQRQRVAMGRALVRNPKIFLFDEPLSNLDAKLRIEMRTELKKLHRNLGATIVYVTHDQIEAMTLATKVVVMSHGEIQQIGSPQEIYEYPANLFVAAFIGSPPMNLFPAELDPTGRRVAASGKDAAEVVLDVIPHAPASDGKPRPVVAGIRPESITLDPRLDRPNANRFSAPIEITEPTGADSLAFFTLGGVDVVARLPAGPDLAGKQVQFTVEKDKILLYDRESGKLLAPANVSTLPTSLGPGRTVHGA